MVMNIGQKPDTPSFSRALADHVAQIYPAVDTEALAARVVEAFWPEGQRRRNRRRTRGNRLWSQGDILLITYGNSLVDGVHKPLDLLNDFLRRYLRETVNGVHVLPFFPFTSDDGFAVTDFRAVNPQLGDWADINRIADRVQADVRSGAEPCLQPGAMVQRLSAGQAAL